MAYTKSSKFAVKFCAKSPFNKGAKNPEPPEPPEEDMTEKVHELPTAEVIEYTGTKREQKRKRREDEGVGSNFRRAVDKWEAWKQRRQDRLNKEKVDRSSSFDTNPLS